MLLRGRLPLEETKSRSLAKEARPWLVSHDPSRSLLNSTYRSVDLQAGGFDCDTTFVHKATGEIRIADANGVVIRTSKKGFKKKKK